MWIRCFDGTHEKRAVPDYGTRVQPSVYVTGMTAQRMGHNHGATDGGDRRIAAATDKRMYVLQEG